MEARRLKGFHPPKRLCQEQLVQPVAEVLSRSEETGRREPWERGCGWWLLNEALTKSYVDTAQVHMEPP